jgi:DNA-binding NtrC family response regulator
MGGMAKVLVVDDEPAMVKVLTGFLAQEKIPCISAPSGEAALRVLHAEDVGVIVTDLKMTGMDGLQLLEHALNIDRSLQVILITAHGTSEIGQRAWEMGAAGYVRKPFDRDEILFEIRRAIDRMQATAEVAESAGEMVGQSGPMKEVFSVVAKVAPTSSTVLIRGESGTGKELVARAVHDQSKRKGKPFIKVICAALPETLIESELFGYEKGAFTGAAASKPGRFELAEGGTIFLDEIGDLTPATQVKLLRVLQDRQFERLGGTQTLRADVRVLAATHRDLEALVKEGKFREDLFYRINVVPVRVPSLRERKEDIPLLCEHLMKKFRAEHGKPSIKLDGKAVALLSGHDWPGNVRELQNVIERLVVLNQSGLILEQDVASCIVPRGGSVASGGGAPVALGASVADAEKGAIREALKARDGNRTHAAKMLGISRRTLHNKLREYGIE